MVFGHLDYSKSVFHFILNSREINQKVKIEMVAIVYCKLNKNGKLYVLVCKRSFKKKRSHLNSSFFFKHFSSLSSLHKSPNSMILFMMSVMSSLHEEQHMLNTLKLVQYNFYIVDQSYSS